MVSIVLPAFNEAAAVGEVVRALQRAMVAVARPYEIIVVDDGSTDATSSVAERAGALVVQQPVSRGSGAARKLGILQSRGEIVVMLDADGSYDASAVPELLRHFPAYDQVNGARTCEAGTLRWLRAPAKWVLRRLACYLARTSIPDLNTGLKAFKREVALQYLWVLPNGFSCVTSLTLAFLMNGHTVKYVPVPYRPRIGRSKFHPVKDTAAYFTTIVRMTMYFAPLRILGPLAAALAGLCLAKGSYDVIVESTLQESDVILAVSTVLILALGMIADLIVAQRSR